MEGKYKKIICERYDFDDKVGAEVRLAGSHVVGTRTPLMMHDHDQTSTWS